MTELKSSERWAVFDDKGRADFFCNGSKDHVLREFLAPRSAALPVLGQDEVWREFTGYGSSVHPVRIIPAEEE